MEWNAPCHARTAFPGHQIQLAGHGLVLAALEGTHSLVDEPTSSSSGDALIIRNTEGWVCDRLVDYMVICLFGVKVVDVICILDRLDRLIVPRAS